MLKRLSTMSFEDSSINRRILSAEAGLRSYLDRPILGWGPENFLIAWGRHYDFESGTREIFDQAHSKTDRRADNQGRSGSHKLSADLVCDGAGGTTVIPGRIRLPNSSLSPYLE